MQFKTKKINNSPNLIAKMKKYYKTHYNNNKNAYRNVNCNKKKFKITRETNEN